MSPRLLGVQFHFKTMQGLRNWTNAEAPRGRARTRETHRADRFESESKGGDFPKCKSSCRPCPEATVRQALVQPVFDLTKVCPANKDYPPYRVGGSSPQSPLRILFRPKVEQARRSSPAQYRAPGGQPFARARLLQARIFFPNADAAPPSRSASMRSDSVQQAALPGAHLQRRWRHAASQANPNPAAYYEPNSFNGPVQDQALREPRR